MENGPFIVNFPIKNGGSCHSYVKLPEGISRYVQIFPDINIIWDT
jgi:hypothetical protein